MYIALITAAVIFSQIVLWGLIFLWLRSRLQQLSRQMREECRKTGSVIFLGPASCNYRGAKSVYGTVRGNGVICLTDKDIVFRKVFGNSIEIPLSNIGGVSVEDRFMGKASAGTGGKILVIHTRDRSEIGFLLGDAAGWEDKLRSLSIH